MSRTAEEDKLLSRPGRVHGPIALTTPVRDQRHIVLFDNGYTVLRVGYQYWNLQVTVRGPGENSKWRRHLRYTRMTRVVRLWNEIDRSCIQWIGANAAD